MATIDHWGIQKAAWQLEDAFQDIRIDVYPDTNKAQPKAREAHFQFVTGSGLGRGRCAQRGAGVEGSLEVTYKRALLGLVLLSIFETPTWFESSACPHGVPCAATRGAHGVMSVDDEAGDEAVPRAASPGALSRRRLLKAAEHGCAVWYFEVKLGGPRAGEVAKQLPPGRPHLRAVRLSLCERLDRAAGASVAWPRLAGTHGDGSLAEAVKGSLLRSAPRGYEVLEIESLSPPLAVKDFWVNVPEDVLDLGVELSGAPLHEASIVRAFLGGLVWGHGLQARDLLVWIEGRPTSEMSPEEVSEELRAVRPLRLGFVRLASQGFEVHVASPGRSRSPGAGDLGQVDQELQELRERRQHLQQLQQKLVEVQSQAAQQEAAHAPSRPPRTPLAEEGFQQGYFQESLASGYPQTSQNTRRGAVQAQLQQGTLSQTPFQQPSSTHLPQAQVHAQSQQPGHLTSAGAPALQQSGYPNSAHGPAHLHPSTSAAGPASFQQTGHPQMSSAPGSAHLQQPSYSQMPSASGPAQFQQPGYSGGPPASGPAPFQQPGYPQVFSRQGPGPAHLQQPGYPQMLGSGPTQCQQPGYPQVSAAQGSAHLQQPGYLHASAQAEASQLSGHSQMLQATQQQAAQAGGQQGAFPHMPQVPAHLQQQGSSYPAQSPFEPGYSQTSQLQSQMPQGGALVQPGSQPSAESAPLQPGYQPGGNPAPNLAVRAGELGGLGGPGVGGFLANGGVVAGASVPLASDASGFLGGLEGGSAALAQGPQELMSQAASAVLGGAAESVTVEEMSEPKKLEEEQSKASEEAQSSHAGSAGREESSQSEELKAMCEKQEQEVLLPAVAAAKAETEEATARGFYAQEAATEEVASELEEVREEKMQLLAASEEAEARLCERTAEMQLRYETEEQESLLPALAAARVEKEEAAARGFYARESAMEEVASELQKIREEQTKASVALDEAEEKLEMAKAREQVTSECEEAAAKEVKNWEELLQQREKEILSQSELRDREHEAAFHARYETQERELLFPAVSAAKAETEEAAARGFYAREAALEEVQGDLRKLRNEQSLATLSREEAQQAVANAIRQDSLTREMEDQAALEVSKWEAQLAAREQSLRSQQEHQEREFLGEAKTEQQLSSALRVRELALRAGEEDLKAKLRSREQVILQEQREMEALEKRAEEMMALALKRRQTLLVEEQKEGEALELRAQERARELLAESEERRKTLQSEAQESLEAAEQRAQELLQVAQERREEVVLQEERELEAMEKQVEELAAEKQAQVEASGELYLLHGSRTPAAVALVYVGQIWEADLRVLGRPSAGFFQPARPTLRPPRATSRMKQVLCTVRQDNEDIADEYILDTVLQACPKQGSPTC
ncbi:hypothetical protein AK812_SmicGene22807 [Symbiodinium microadriaticum]|uniref:PDZ domain-containing protein n=1 Tax=Symbiodinium microadriaticum TaxID=2951 RepID=A0A1Q9DIY8_SYMMI|nr:hypothetical protein AK812_SmicGene22807 [Symbiodinium microadriaticum]